MDVIKLRAFCTVASLGSISKAAERLNYTQPAISAQIRELENELGNKLLERVGRHIQLTEAGRLFQAHAQRLIRDFDDCLRALPEEQGGKGGFLRIGASSLPGVHLLPSLLAEFWKKYPGISFSVSVQSAYVVERMLLDRQIDIGFLGRRSLKRRNLRISEYPLLREALVAAIPIGHPWSTLKEIRPEDFAGEPLIMPPRNAITRRNADEVFREHGVELDLVFEVNNSETIKRMVSEGLGVTILCADAAAKEAASNWLAVVPIVGMGQSRYLSLMVDKEREVSRDLRLFMDFTLEYYAGKVVL